MNVALIFAGGVGTRMNSNAKPKQFLELHGKPIIIHTIDLFEKHKNIDAIVVSCVEEWIDYLKELIVHFHIKKVVSVVPGGSTGQESIYNGLTEIEKLFPADSIVLIHDGVRPLINEQIISDNIESVKKYGSAVTTAPTTETFVITDDNREVIEVPLRSHSRLAKAPQSYILQDILSIHRLALKDGIVNSIDSCTLMKSYGKTLKLVEGPVENIKITTPTDFYIFKAIYEAREYNQIVGL